MNIIYIFIIAVVLGLISYIKFNKKSKIDTHKSTIRMYDHLD